MEETYECPGNIFKTRRHGSRSISLADRGACAPGGYFSAVVAALFIAAFVRVDMGIPQLLTIDPTPVFHCQAKQGQTVTAEFSVRNVTDTPVRILGATAACTCAKVSTDLPIEIQPGATARIDVLVRVGPPNQERVFSNSTNLLVNRRGLVPPLVVSATVVE